jgi:hypothetical protein
MTSTIVWLLLSLAFTSGPSTQPQTGIIEVVDPFPPSDQYVKVISPIARKYGLSVPGKSFDGLRSIRLTADGRSHPPEPDAPKDRDAPVVSPTTHAYTYFVPPSYASSESDFGLIVWVAPEVSAGIRIIPTRLPKWLDAMEKHKLVWVEPRGAPNESHSVWRIFAAMESVRHAKRRYRIDPDRVYIAGLSGGGRISSHASVFFPDVFDGCFAIVGCNYYRDVPAGKNRVYPGFWTNPDAAIIRRARQDGRFVLLTGSEDFNHPSTRAAYEEFVKDGWAHVTYLEVPGMGHSFPDGDWFEKGIVALDKPLREGAADTYAKAQELEKKRKLGEACLAFERSARHGGQGPFVADAASRAKAIRQKFDSQVADVERFIRGRQFDKAAATIRQLKQDYAPMSDDVCAKLLEDVRAARGGGGAATRPGSPGA